MTLKELKQKAELLTQNFEAEEIKDIEELKVKYLGKKGLVNELMKSIPQLDGKDKGAAGGVLNLLKTDLTEKIDALKSASKTKTDWFDVTQPTDSKIGSLHPVTHAIDEITRIFNSMGFTRVRYPEVDWDWYAFEALNMPKTHPARDEWETFFVDMPIDKKLGKVVLTPHTSNGQVREMERLNNKPPIRMINIAKCYRRQVDVTHIPMFHQFEGLVVDKGINIQHLKGTIDYFA